MQTAQFELHAAIEDRHWWFVARRKIVRRLIDHVLGGLPSNTNGNGKSSCTSPHPTPLPRGEGTRRDTRPLVIDIGCGTGANIASLADSYRCVGIDTSVDAIQWARQKFPDVQFINGFAPKDLGEQIHEARLITMMDVLEHVEDDFALLSNVLAECAANTYILLTVPADLSLWSKHDETFGHYRRYNPERLAKLWSGLGVETLLLSHYNSRLYPLVKAVRSVNRLFRRSAGEHGTDFRLPVPPLNRLYEAIFAGEAETLFDTLSHDDEGYERGVSLIALLRRKAGVIERRSKPHDAGPDFYDPRIGRLIGGGRC